MATPAIREIVSASKVYSDSSSLTVVTGGGTQVDDLLVCFHGADYGSAGDMDTPTGTPGTWTFRANGDQGANQAHVEVWTRPVTAAGSQTIILPAVPTASHFVTVYVLNKDTVHPTAAFDGAAGSQGGSSTSHTAPAVSPLGTTDLLICAAQTSNTGDVDYTPPGGMTEQTEVDIATWSTMSTATLVLAAAGSTGTKTFTASVARQWATVSIVIRGAAPLRLYLANAAAGYTPATVRGTWDDVTAGTTPNLLGAKTGAAATKAVAEINASATWDVFLGRWVTAGLALAGTVAGTVDICCGLLESNADANFQFVYHIYLTQGATDLVRGTLSAGVINTTELPTTAAGYLSTSIVSTVGTAQAGDRIVVELGYRATNTIISSRTGTLNYGNTGSTDLTAGSTSVTTQPGWVEFHGFAELMTAPTAVTIADTPRGAQGGVSGPGLIGATVFDTPRGAQGGTPGSVLAVGVTRTDTPRGAQGGTPGSAVAVELAGLPAGGPLTVAFWAVDRVTGVLTPLPDVGSFQLSPIANAAGSVTLEYPTNGKSFSVLRDGVTDKRDLEIEIWFRGQAAGALRAILDERSGDDVAEGGDNFWTFGGHFLERRMTDAVTSANVANEKKEWVFTGASAGTIMALFMGQAQARGTLTDVTYSTFSGTHGSNGVAFTKLISLAIAPQVGYMDVLANLVEHGACEWEITPQHALKIYEPGSRGTDRTLESPPVIFRRGRTLTDAPRKVSVRDAATDLFVAGGEGLYATQFDVTARSLRGRQVERTTSQGGITTAAALNAYAANRLQTVIAGQEEVTHGLFFGAGDPIPPAGFHLGDWVYSYVADGSDVSTSGNRRLRVVQWSMQRDRSGTMTGTITLNTIIDERLIALGRKLAAMESGVVVSGASSPSERDTIPPQAPTGLVCTSLPFIDAGGNAQSAVQAAWVAVTLNADGSVTNDLSGYRLRYRYTAATMQPAIWFPAGETAGLTLDFGPVEGGAQIEVQVAAFDQWDNVSAYSTGFFMTTETDLTPPPVPSTPIMANYLGVVSIAWDGLGSAGEVLAGQSPQIADYDHIEVHVSTVDNFTPTAATLFDTLVGAGATVWTVQAPAQYGIPIYARFISVDRRGNRSAAGFDATATPAAIGFPDMGPNAVDSAQIRAAAILSAHIGVAQIQDAHVSNMSVGKLTAGLLSATVTLSGILQTATSGARWVADSAGMRLYNANGVVTVDFKAANGMALVTGQFQTAISGKRLIINPGGTEPDMIQFFPDNTSNFGILQSQTVNSTGQTILVGRGNSTRGDQAAGEFGAHPDEGFIRWAIPQTTGADTPFSFFVARRQSAEVRAPQIDLFVEDRYPAFGQDRHFTHSFRDTTGADIAASVMWFRTGAVSQPWIDGLNQNCGLLFDANQLNVVNGTPAFGPIGASAFNVNSGANVKQDIEEIDLPAEPDPDRSRRLLRGFRRARSQQWRYRDEVADEARSDFSGDTHRVRIEDVDGNPVLDSDGHETYTNVPSQYTAPPRRAKRHYGPMAEDLPPEVVETDPAGRKWLSLGDGLGFLWKIAELIEARKLHTVETRVATPALIVGTPVDVSVSWPGAPLPVVPDDVVVHREALTVGESLRIRTTAGSITADGCVVTVELRSGVPILASAGVLHVVASAWV